MPASTPYTTNQDDPAPLTRVDMLLALYAEAVKQTQLAIDAVCQQQDGQAAIHRTRGAAIVAAIRTGIDLNQGGVTDRVDQLCEFVQFCLTDGTESRIRSALGVLQQLQDGFQGVRSDAIRLEQNGTIPPLTAVTTVDSTV